MSEPMKLTRSQALAALAFCGYKSMGEFDNERLSKKMSTYNQLWPKGDTPPDDIKELVEGIFKHAEADGKFAVEDDPKAEGTATVAATTPVAATETAAIGTAGTDDAPAAADGEKKRRGRPAKPKAEKAEGEDGDAAPKEKTKRVNKRGGHGFDFLAGRLMKKRGGAVEKVTDEMVAEYLALRDQAGTEKEKRQAKIYLGWANQILKGYFEADATAPASNNGETTPAAQPTAAPATTA